jgi:hypothetical protein
MINRTAVMGHDLTFISPVDGWGGSSNGFVATGY